MKKHPIAAIINFCTNESRFLKLCVEQCFRFSRQVIIPVCDHFFDGIKEDRELLESIYASFPNCLFVEYPFIPDKLPGRIRKTVDLDHFWPSLSRYLGSQFLDDRIEMVLFLDVDEIPDGERFSEWLECSDYLLHTALKMANYWYFREPRYRAENWEDSIVLAQRRALEASMLLRQEERDAIYDSLPGPKRRMVVGVDGHPMFHHYSWVRTQEEMLKKVRAWGHRTDRNWEALVEKEFSQEFLGVDFVHGYKFQTVQPTFPVHFNAPEFSRVAPLPILPHVKRLDIETVLAAIKKGKGSFWKSFLPFSLHK